MEGDKAMLASLRGTVLKKDDFTAVIECSGFGIEVLLTRNAADLCVGGAGVFLYTYLQTSDAGMALYGFADEPERRIFKMMMGIKGIGGKVAISMLQYLSPAEIVSAVLEGDAKLLTVTPGIGKRTADRICFELAGSLRKGGFEDFAISGTDTGTATKTSSTGAAAGGDSSRRVVLDALESLGFDRAAGLRAYNAVIAEGGEGKEESDVIMRCLRKLQPRK